MAMCSRARLLALPLALVHDLEQLLPIALAVEGFRATDKSMSIRMEV